MARERGRENESRLQVVDVVTVSSVARNSFERADTSSHSHSYRRIDCCSSQRWERKNKVHICSMITRN